MIESSLHPSEPVALPDRPVGRTARSVLGHALLLALMLVIKMPVFVPAVLFHCGLRLGRRAAWLALFVATALAALYIPAAFKQPDDVKKAVTTLAALVLSIAVPAIAVLPLVERAEKFGRVLLFLLAGCGIGLAVTELGGRALLGYSRYAADVARLKAQNAAAVEFYRTANFPSDVLRLIGQWLDYTLSLLPAGSLITAAVFFIFSLVMLSRLQVWRERSAGRDADTAGVYLFRNLSLPEWLLFAFVFGGLTPLVTGMLHKVAANVLTVVVVLYLLQGLAIFRFFLATTGAAVLGWLLLLFLLITGVAPIAFGVAGLFDPFFDFRHFKKRKDDSHESHSD